MSRIVYLVDDDPGVRRSLHLFFTSVGLDVRCYASAKAFLADYKPGTPGCLLLDLRMPEMDGFALAAELRRRHIQLPLLILSAYGEVPSVVQSMKLGALDFLEKPADPSVLLDKVSRAIDQYTDRRKADSETAAASEHATTLTATERSLVRFLILGKSNKQIARELKRSPRTIANHRAHVMHKMQAVNAADLVRRCMLAGLLAPDERLHPA